MSSSGISAFWLKIIAITGMVLQHAALSMRGVFPIGLEIFLQISGGLTFPVLAYFLVEGYRHTSDLKRYKTRLLIFGAIAFIPHLMSLGSGMNIMFTLLAGLILLDLRSRYGSTVKFWLCFALASILIMFFDWSIVALVVILLNDVIKTEKLRRILVPIVAAVGLIVYSVLLSMFLAPFVDMEALAANQTIAGAFFPIGSLLAIPLLLMYKGKRGKRMKWFFYWFYPIHLAVLGIIALLLGTNNFINAVQEAMYAMV